jgi:hypothetical protein
VRVCVCVEERDTDAGLGEPVAVNEAVTDSDGLLVDDEVGVCVCEQLWLMLGDCVTDTVPESDMVWNCEGLDDCVWLDVSVWLAVSERVGLCDWLIDCVCVADPVWVVDCDRLDLCVTLAVCV